MICPNCSKEVAEGLSYCGHCGGSLPVGGPPSQSDQAYLSAIEGPLAGQAQPLATKGLIIGRGSACDLRLLDQAASRQHAHIRYAQGAWYIQDLGSAGGTFINQKRVQAIRLNSGDMITIGKSTWTFHVEPPPVEPIAEPVPTPSERPKWQFPIWLWIVHGAMLLIFAALITLVAIAIKNGLLSDLFRGSSDAVSEETSDLPAEPEEASGAEPQGRLPLGPMLRQTPIPGPEFTNLLMADHWV